MRARFFSTLAKAPAVYVSVMTVAQQWKTLGSELPEGWTSASLRLELRDPESADQAAAALAPAGPYRVSPTILQFSVARDGTALGPDAIARHLANVPVGELSLSNSAVAARPAEREATPLAASWDALLAGLPADWSDLYAEVEFTSSDFIEPAAVLCIQMNPRRDGTRAAFRFRAARVAGYGVVAGHGAPLLRALRREGDRRHDHRPARAQRHAPRRHAGPRLARRRRRQDVLS